MMGPRQIAQGALFYEFSLEDHVPADHLLINRPVRRSFVCSGASRAVLQLDRQAVSRSRVDDPHADHRLYARDPLGAAALRGGSSEPSVSLVLPPRSDRSNP